MRPQIAFIDERYESLRNSEMKVADAVLNNADEVIHFSVSQLAELAQVSDPTVIRFCRSLGFKGFQDFKLRLAQQIITPVKNIHEAMTEHEDTPELVRKIFAANQDAIQQTLSTIDLTAVSKALAEIAKAKKLIFYGLGGSAAVAMDAYHKFLRTGIFCEWFCDTHMAAMAASMMKPGQVFVAISHSGATQEVIDVVQEASRAGACTIGITSYAKSMLTKKVRYSLLVGSAETGFRFEPMASRIAQLCVIDVLAVGTALQRTDEVIVNIKKSRNAIAKRKY